MMAKWNSFTRHSNDAGFPLQHATRQLNCRHCQIIVYYTRQCRIKLLKSRQYIRVCLAEHSERKMLEPRVTVFFHYVIIDSIIQCM